MRLTRFFTLFFSLISPLIALGSFETLIVDRPFQSSSKIVITKEEIAQSGSSNIAQLLEKLGGFSSVNGAFVTNQLYLRGGDSSHILVLLDGVPLYDATSPQRSLNINLLPLSLIERIEILKGSQVVAFGGQALIGVISIKTISADPSYTYKVKADLGSIRKVDQGELELGYQKRLSDTQTLQVFLTWKDNQYRSPVANSTRIYPDLKQSLDFGYFQSLAKYDWIVRARTSHQERDIISRTVDVKDFESINQVSSMSTILKSRGETYLPSLSFSVAESLRAYLNEIDQSPNLPLFDEKYKGRLVYMSLSQPLYRHDTGLYTLGLSHANEYGDFEIAKTIPPGTNDRYYDERQEIFGASLLGSEKISDWLEVTAGMRYEKYTTPQEKNSYQLGFNFGESWKLEFAEGFKSPTLFQRFSPSYGNSSLRAETAKTVSLEYSLNIDDYSLSIAPFYSQFEDLITITNQGFGLKYYNVSEARVTGLETLVRWRWSQFIFGVNATYQEPEDLSAQRWLIRRPFWLAGGYVTQQWNAKWRTGLDVSASGAREDFGASSTVRVKLKQYEVWGLTADYQMREGLKSKFQIKNIFDERFEESFSYLSEGRTVYAGLEWTQ
ncbi:MAG: TonB-dependent receptor [Proteobacteria bacterium]|nr:TonB-dependent receptor [Pseudomonadota bacterium]